MCAQRKAGRRQRARRRFACCLYPSHGLLRFITSRLPLHCAKTKRLRRRLWLVYGPSLCIAEECTEHNSTIYLTFSPDGNMSVSPQSFLKFPVGSASFTHSQSDFLVETSGFWDCTAKIGEIFAHCERLVLHIDWCRHAFFLMLILRLNCDAALANLSTRTCISVALCDITALSSVENNSLMTIRLFLVLAFNCVTFNRLAPS